MRRLYGYLGIALGPILGTAYFLLLKLRNGGRQLEQVRMLPPGGKELVDVIIIRKAKWLPADASAITFGKRVYTKALLPSTGLIAHELVHVEQYKRWGWFGFLSRYGADMGLHGYDGSWIEEEARHRAGHR